MPIRFRCPHCARLLGIARRKAGTRVRCPECERGITVPGSADVPELDDIDELLNPAAAGYNGTTTKPRKEARDAPPVVEAPAVEAPPVEPPRAKVQAPAPEPRPERKRRPAGDDPLFERDDVDALLGVPKRGEMFELGDEPKAKPVSGPDALSLDDTTGQLVLTPARLTLLVVSVVILLGVAFAGGFLIASNL